MISCMTPYCGGFLYEDFPDPRTKEKVYTCILCARSWQEKQIKNRTSKSKSTTIPIIPKDFPPVVAAIN